MPVSLLPFSYFLFFSPQDTFNEKMYAVYQVHADVLFETYMCVWDFDMDV